MPPAALSVVIPAYESWPLLERTLAAVLHDLRAAGGPWELIVVDNDSRPPLAFGVYGLARPGEELRVLWRTGLGGRHFQPGAARNAALAVARHDHLVFLDSDCVPAAGLLRRYRALLAREPGVVLLGHRVFVDADGLDAGRAASDRALLDACPRVASRSNYGVVEDRRLAELRALDTHPRPYDCLFGCNFALHRDTLGEVRFDPAYDGHWGYEDIDLGYRLHLAGRRFRYVPDAFVYHQEGEAFSDAERLAGRRRNFALLASRVPGYLAYRSESRRPGAMPEGIVA